MHATAAMQIKTRSGLMTPSPNGTVRGENITTVPSLKPAATEYLKRLKI
jgi:hypothetical protein